MSKEEWQERTAEGFGALQGGDPARAVALLERAMESARRTRDAALVDEARVNLSQARQQAGDPDGAEEGLREILLRSSDPKLVLGASLTIARARKALRDPARAHVFLGRAMEAARRVGSRPHIASVHVERANLHMQTNRLEDASDDYSEALRLLEEDGARGYPLALALDNLGYCRVLLDDLEGGVPLLRRSCREADEHGVVRYVAEACQDLCFAHLKNDDPVRAEVRGSRSLRVADREGYADILKNVLYLLGEACCRQGRPSEGQVYFRRLQEHYPGMPDLGRFLTTFDISSMITLKEF